MVRVDIIILAGCYSRGGVDDGEQQEEEEKEPQNNKTLDKEQLKTIFPSCPSFGSFQYKYEFWDEGNKNKQAGIELSQAQNDLVRVVDEVEVGIIVGVTTCPYALGLM